MSNASLTNQEVSSRVIGVARRVTNYSLPGNPNRRVTQRTSGEDEGNILRA